MIKDYVEQEYEIVERVMSNGKKRYNVYVANAPSPNNLVTMSGNMRPKRECQTFLYMQHEVDKVMQVHQKRMYQLWLRDIEQAGKDKFEYPHNPYDPSKTFTFWEAKPRLAGDY